MASTRFEHIAVPLDGSALAEQVLPYVEDLARVCGARVTLVRVAEPGRILADPAQDQLALGAAASVPGSVIGGPIPTVMPTHVPPDPLMAPRESAVEVENVEATGYLNILANQLRDQGIRVDHAELEGSPVEALNEWAAAAHVSLIAMATHARSGLERFFFGSVADKILQHAPCPVLLLRVDERAEAKA